jgi:hypothetical protein
MAELLPLPLLLMAHHHQMVEWAGPTIWTADPLVLLLLLLVEAKTVAAGTACLPACLPIRRSPTGLGMRKHAGRQCMPPLSELQQGAEGIMPIATMTSHQNHHHHHQQQQQ